MGKTRAILAATAIAALTLTTAACSSGGGGGGSSSGSDKDTTLTYWASNQGTSIQNDKDVLTPVLDKFTQKTGIKVKLEVIGWNDLQTRIQTAVSSGQGPDVVNIGNTWGAWLQSTGAFAEFNDANMKAIGGADKFVKTALDAGGAPGKTPTSVPLYGLAYGLYYNKAMFADAGLQPPTTWEEFVAAAKQLTTGGKYGLALAAASYTENIHFAFLTAAQNGASFYDKDGKPTFTSQPIVDGLSRYLALMQTDKVVNPGNAQYDNGTQAIADFASGKAAMVLSQNNADASIKADGMSPDDYGVVALPSPKNAKAEVATFPAGINLSIFKYTKHLSQALKFVKYMTSEDTQSTLDKPYAALPVLAGAKASFTDNADEAKVFLDAYNNKSKPLPQVATEGSFESTIGKGLSQEFATIATGGTVSDADIKAMLKTAQEQVEAQG
ncbi:sugar ABC transporter substrate-binding protein [Microbacterium sp. STN6]|uniref:ABC transporter substrate-binding protein n=1 Tax=Microbacterium sp. STN6 TaxID=2995588 RepID=UPI002260C05F|nr:sugar ABC transporter substrate-binding protein [Microbacterium sp. STN6]MCX7521102.1 sugar ABC transporter substrate-binding protein [Microbacterium sp. STN6]